MRTTFFIELTMKTVSGFERFGSFELGEDSDFAAALFSILEGHSLEGDSGVLHMGLVEERRGLPVNMQVIACSMEELCRNIKVITREMFKRINLGEMPA